MAADTVHRRRILLNRLLISSAAKVSERDEAPIHTASELFAILDRRRKNGEAIEFFGTTVGEDNDRDFKQEDHDFIRLVEVQLEIGDNYDFAVLMFEYVDADQDKFPVVHRLTREGREIAGDEHESAGYTSHVVIALPKDESYDNRDYRCCIEYSSMISRRALTSFLCRQLRRVATDAEWTFTVNVQRGRGRPKIKNCRYWPKMEFVSDVGRRLSFVEGGQELRQIVFTKRSEKLSVAQESEIEQKDVYGEIIYKVKTAQGPDDPEEKKTWITNLRDTYEKRGFKTKLYFKSIGGDVLSGPGETDADSAADLMLCQNETIELDAAPRAWRRALDRHTVEKLKGILDRDDLWERVK